MIQTVITIVIVLLAAALAAHRLYRIFKGAADDGHCTPERCAHCPHASDQACVPGKTEPRS